MFFLKNRVKMPSTRDWEPQPTREPTKGRLDVDKVVEIIKHSKIREQAIFLTMFQSLMDLERFVQFNRKYAGPLVEHIKAGKFDEPFRIDYASGRKRNKQAFHTFIHRDALQAWKDYFERIRGYPKPAEPIALEQYEHEVSKSSIRHAFITVAEQLRIRPRRKGTRDISNRTGAAPHEAFRDVVRTMLRTRAKKDGFDLEVAEYWMGHRIDKYNYDKFAELEPEYDTEHAKIASKYLNVISNSQAQETSEIAQLREEFAKLKGQFETAFKKQITNETGSDTRTC
jgi:hypothetical protein